MAALRSAVCFSSFRTPRLNVCVCRLDSSILGHPLPLPNCFLLFEQKLHKRQSGPNYFKQIQNHKPGHGWVQFSVTLWQWKLCLAVFWIPAITNPRDVTAFSKTSSSVIPSKGLRAVAFQRNFVVLGPSLQKDLVFLKKGLWHPGSALESSEFGKSELCKKSLQ